MNIKIEIRQIPVYTSENGYQVVYSAITGKRSLYDKNGRKTSIIPKEHIKEVNDLQHFSEQHHNKTLTLSNPTEDDGHN